SLHSWYTVDIATSRRLVRVEKRFSELRALDAQLRALLAREPPALADITDVDMHDSRLRLHKRTSGGMEARRLTAQRYL
ncbi:hypothetical protein OFC56_40490, partial [Escherichia coli]|nr:hypothetical protein [Escherichia coli]